jgi:hypothetical protein
MTGIFRMPFDCTFATGCTRTYIAIFFNKRLPKCDRHRVLPVAKYLFQVAPKYMKLRRGVVHIQYKQRATPCAIRSLLVSKMKKKE